MEIRINGKLAALKKGTSFEYVSENRLFSGSDGYTLSITFPLRGCPQNLAIFGNINRADVIAGKVIFDCEIRDRNFYKFGCITIIEINDAEVKTQFLDGRSEQNFDKTFDKTYINELDLGNPSGCKDSTPDEAWFPTYQGDKCVALPWVNDASGNIQNLPEYHPEERDKDGRLIHNSYWTWHKDCRGRSWQPYLLYITRQICEAIEYTPDFSQWEDKEEYKYLLICNCLPYAWNVSDFAHALPHWTVDEYFEKLELFMGGEFTIDHRAKTISFAFTKSVLANTPEVFLQNIVDEHSVEVTVEDDKCDYSEMKNLVYKECDHEMWKYYSCDWFLKSLYSGNIVEYDSMNELLEKNRWLKDWNGSTQRNSNRDKVLYARNIDTYFVVRSLSKALVEKRGGWMPNLYAYKMALQPINIFGGRIIDDSDDADEIEVEFVPAWIDHTEDKYGNCLFLSFSGFDENESTESSFRTDPDTRKQEIDATLYQPFSVQWLQAGEAEKKAEYYDRIYVGWWDGAPNGDTGLLPYPRVADVEVNADWSGYTSFHFSIRLNNRITGKRDPIHTINPKQKTTFKFLSDTIPNPRAVFNIKGKRYLAEKITATFTENGMSQLLKIVAWPIIES